MDRILKFFIINIFLWMNSDVASANKLNLNGATTTQVGTWNDHYSSLAIDGNVNTYSVACVRCDANNPTDTIGWWRVNFNQEVEVAGVELISSHNYPDSDYLQEIEVGIAAHSDSNQNNVVKCGEHGNRNMSIPANDKIIIVCPQKFRGRSVLIKRKPGALIRPDAISIAEVNIYSERGDWIPRNYVDGNNNPSGNDGNDCVRFGQNNPNCYNNGQNYHPNSPSNNSNNNPINIRDKPAGRETTIHKAIQSSTYGSHQAEYAIDGKDETFSIAVPNQYWQHAWWQADLGVYYHVAGLTIVSSHDYTNAQYLKNFEVLVSQHDYAQDPQFQYSQKCITVSDQGVIPTKTLIAFKCSNPLFGRFVIVKSTSGCPTLSFIDLHAVLC